METVKFVYWQDGTWWLGYLSEFPDYWTQGESFDDLKGHLADLYKTLSDGTLPGVRRTGELTVA